MEYKIYAASDKMIVSDVETIGDDVIAKIESIGINVPIPDNAVGKQIIICCGAGYKFLNDKYRSISKNDIIAWVKK